MPHQEQQYLEIIERVIEEGYHKPSPHDPLPSQPDPPGTLELINQNMTFDLSSGEFPFMTVRKVFFRSMAAELLWFLSGSTNNLDLVAQGVKMWNPWDTPETNQAMGWAPGQLGPIYGKQWRHWGARMSKPDGQLDWPGYDQIDNLVKKIAESPNSKRIFVTSYDPLDIDDCFVTTCHGQFFISVWGDHLNLHMIQRSGDLPVGVPYNIGSYALLLMLLAQVTGLKPGQLDLTISNAHVYDNQVDAMKVVLLRKPLPYSKVQLNPNIRSIFDFGLDDFGHMDYQAHPNFTVPVAV